MRRYLKLWMAFFRISWMADFEYRFNIILKILGEMIWYIVQLSVFEVLYTHTDSISGWTIEHMRVFMGTLFLVESMHMIFLSENLDYFFSLVRKGDLDLYLTKPVNSQFMISCRKISASYIANFFLVLAYLGWVIAGLDKVIYIEQIVSYVVLLICGFFIHYAFRFSFNLVALILQDASSFQFVWFQFQRLGNRPDILYPRTLRILVLTFFPVAFFASVPSRVIVEGLYYPNLIAGLTMAVGLVYLSNVLWKRALKHYASASS